MLRDILPAFILKRLFGNRELYTKNDNKKHEDVDWKFWTENREKIYNDKSSRLLKFIEKKGYKQIKNIDFTNKNIFELGPGKLPHLSMMNFPANYDVADVDKNFVSCSINLLNHKKIKYNFYDMKSNLIERNI